MRYILALVLTLCGTARAAGNQSDRNFGFGPLEIYEFRPGTSELRVQDINGNGRDEVIFVNNHASRIEILLRKSPGNELPDGALPALEDKFENTGFLVDQQILFSALADLNNNGREDLVAFGHALGLQLWRQNNDSTFSRPARLHLDRLQDVVGLRLADVSGNGLPDIVLCRRNGAEIIWNSGGLAFPERSTVFVSGEASTSLEVMDINGSGRNDLLFFTQTPDAPIRVRTRNANGGFDVETLLHLPPLRHAGLFPGSGPNDPQRIGAILRNGLGFRAYSFITEMTPSLLDAQQVVPGRILLEGIDRRLHPVYVISDINGNGYDDVVVAAPEISRIHVYHGVSQGLSGEPQYFDSLTGINAISRTGSGKFLVVSRRENAAALHDLNREKSFPSIIKLSGTVLTGTALQGTERLFFVCRGDNRKFQLVELQNYNSEPMARDLDIRNEPSEIMVFNAGKDETGIILFAPHSEPVMFMSNGDSLNRIDTVDFPALSSHLTRRNVIPLTKNDTDSILVASGRTARRFDRTDTGYTATRQYNTANAQADIAAACFYKTQGSENGILIYDQNARNLAWFGMDNHDHFRSIHLQNAPSEVFGMETLQGPDRNLLLIVARDSLNVVFSGTDRITLEHGAEYMSVADQPSLQYFRPVTLGAPPRQMLALVDAANRSIEWISENNGSWRRELAFEVFLDSGFGAGAPSGGIEPRDVTSGDLDGNGIGDMVVLVHDKLLVYPGAARK